VHRGWWLFHYHKACPFQLRHKMRRRDPCHHLAGGPETFAPIELESVRYGLLQLGWLGWMEAPSVGLPLCHSESCAPGAGSRTTRKPAVSSAAASCLPVAVTKAGGPPDTRAAASARTFATSSNGTVSGRVGRSGTAGCYRTWRNVARTCGELSPRLLAEPEAPPKPLTFLSFLESAGNMGAHPLGRDKRFLTSA
jgi:hypothetical protein